MSKTILVVDDEENIRDILNDYLTRKGFTVIEAENGVDALEQFSLKPIDLVISDIRMPRMSGLSLLKAIKTINKQLPVIILTGQEVYLKDFDSLPIKADAYITKPIALETIFNLVVKLVS